MKKRVDIYVNVNEKIQKKSSDSLSLISHRTCDELSVKQWSFSPSPSLRLRAVLYSTHHADSPIFLINQM